MGRGGYIENNSQEMIILKRLLVRPNKKVPLPYLKYGIASHTARINGLRYKLGRLLIRSGKDIVKNYLDPYEIVDGMRTRKSYYSLEVSGEELMKIRKEYKFSN